MIEKRILDFLKSSINILCPVVMERPLNSVTEYVVIEKTGSRHEGFVEEATLAIQSYSESLYRACQLNEVVKLEMQELIKEPDISKVKLISDYNFTDTSTKSYRYQAVYTITLL